MSDEELLRAKCRDIFNKFDVDRSGTVSTAEIYQMISLLHISLSDAEVAQLMVNADPDGSGAIDFEEFVAVLKLQIQQGGGAGGGLAQLIVGASDLFGWLNPFSWFASTPTGFAKWVIQTRNQTTAEEMRQADLARKQFAAQQKARFLAVQERRIERLHRQSQQAERAAQHAQATKQQECQQTKLTRRREIDTKKAMDKGRLRSLTAQVRRGRKYRDALKKEQQEEMAYHAAMAHDEEKEKRALRRNQAIATKGLLVMASKHLAATVRYETRPELRQDSRDFFQAQRDASASSLRDQSVDNLDKIALAREQFLVDNEERRQDVLHLDFFRAKTSREHLAAQRKREADELRRRLAAERMRKATPGHRTELFER